MRRAKPGGDNETAAEPTRRRRRRVTGALLAGAVAIAAVIAAIVLVTRDDDDSEARTFDASIETLPLADPASFLVSGVLQGKPLGRVAVIIQRQLVGTPRRGGDPLPIEGAILIFSPDGFIGLSMEGTLALTQNGGEVVRAHGSASNGAGEFESVSGSFTLTGGRASAESLYGRFEIDGTLDY